MKLADIANCIRYDLRNDIIDSYLIWKKKGSWDWLRLSYILPDELDAESVEEVRSAIKEDKNALILDGDYLIEKKCKNASCIIERIKIEYGDDEFKAIFNQAFSNAVISEREDVEMSNSDRMQMEEDERIRRENILYDFGVED